LADQGGVLEGVADRPFFCIPSSLGSYFIATDKANFLYLDVRGQGEVD
jgi:hypothetical protein